MKLYVEEQEENTGNIKEENNGTTLEISLAKLSRSALEFNKKLNKTSDAIKRVENTISAFKLNSLSFELEVENNIWFHIKQHGKNRSIRILISYYEDFPIDCTIVHKPFSECSLQIRNKYINHLEPFIIELNKYIESL